MTKADYSTGELFEYVYDAASNRTAMTSTTPLSGTVVTTYTYDIANRLTDREVSDSRTYTYTWSNRNQLLAEYTQGYPVRTFSYNAAGQMITATVFTLTTNFTYNGDGARIAVSVEGHGATTYTLDYAAGYRILAEQTGITTTLYLYGHECLGELRDDEWLYYLTDGTGYVRQGVDDEGQVVSVWLFDPDGVVLEGPEGPVSHLVCGGVYDWSTGLLYKDGRYFDPLLGIWLALTPLAVIQLWRRRKKGKGAWDVLLVMLVVVGVGVMVTACNTGPIPQPAPQICLPVPAPTPRPTAPRLLRLREDPDGGVDILTDLRDEHLGVMHSPVRFSATVFIPNENENANGVLYFKQDVATKRIVTYEANGVETSYYNSGRNRNDWYYDGKFKKVSRDIYGFAGYPVANYEGRNYLGDVNGLSMLDLDQPNQHTRAPIDEGEFTNQGHPTSLVIEEYFEMYVMWQPDMNQNFDSDANRIPLGMVAWNWRVDADRRNGVWDVRPTPAQPAVWDDTQPSWRPCLLQNAKDIPWRQGASPW